MIKNIYILGGGPAGMACAYYAYKKGVSFSLFESTDQVGGNCKTLTFKDFKFDTGAHRFHDKDKDVTVLIKELLGDRLLEVTSPSKIFWKGKFVFFPIRPLDILCKLGFLENSKIIYENIINQFSRMELNNFKDLAYLNYGKTLSELFLINYTQKLWGCNPEKLSIDISGGRLKNLDFVSAIKDFLFRRDFQHLDGSFLYPKDGFGSIFESIFNVIDTESIFLNSPVSNLIHDRGKIKNIIFKNGKSIELDSSDTVINTLPMPLLIKGLYPRPPEELVRCMDALKYRSLRLFVICLNKDKFSDNASIYFPEEEIPFTRIYEPKNRSKELSPSGKTCIVIELPYETGLSQVKLNKYNIDNIISILIDKKMISAEDLIDSKVLDVPYAYSVITNDAKINIEKGKKYLDKFLNLQSFGRSADFSYNHVHDLFNTARIRVDELSEL